MFSLSRYHILVALIWLVALFSLSGLAQQPMVDNADRLTNKDILQMVKAQLPAETIIEKIKHSRCNFDSDPTQLAELRSKGVSEKILQAMIDAPYGLPSSAKEQSESKVDRSPEKSTQNNTQNPNSVTVTIPEGTFVFRNLSLKADSYSSNLNGEVVNNTNKSWNNLTFQIVGLDSAGNEIKDRYESLLNDLTLYGLGKSETKAISHMFTGLERKPTRIKIIFKSGEYSALYSFTMVKPKPSDQLLYDDGFIQIAFTISKQQIGFVLRNKTDNPISVDWNQVSYIDISGGSHKVMHEGVKYISRSEPQSPSVIPPTAKLTDIVFPIDYVYYSSGRYGGWREESLFPEGELAEKYRGTVFSVFLPLNINGSVKNYLFTFKITNVET